MSMIENLSVCAKDRGIVISFCEVERTGTYDMNHSYKEEAYGESEIKKGMARFEELLAIKNGTSKKDED
jgi:hypothetical protein